MPSLTRSHPAMRIAIMNWSRRQAGGVESYLAGLIPRLIDRGAKLSFCFEQDTPANRPVLGADTAVEFIGPLKNETELQSFFDRWQPDLLYCHGFRNPSLDRTSASTGKVVWFLHQYTGVCIDGAKTHKFPNITPCERTFGAGCLAQYFPRRCGGWNPSTMWKLYREQCMRLETLGLARRLLTHSAHLEREYQRHGFADRLLRVPFPAEPSKTPPLQAKTRDHSEPSRLLYLGRMEAPKGGEVLLRAVDQILAAANTPLHLVMAGDGTSRAVWEQQARDIMARHSHGSIQFTGWLNDTERAEWFERSELLVVPSLWPEPFGLVGPEAAFHSLPCVAFNRGGISEWLQDDVNGLLVECGVDPATNLRRSIQRALGEKGLLKRLSEGARKGSNRFLWEHHMRALEPVFQEALR